MYWSLWLFFQPLALLPLTCANARPCLQSLRASVVGLSVAFLCVCVCFLVVCLSVSMVVFFFLLCLCAARVAMAFLYCNSALAHLDLLANQKPRYQFE